MDGWHWLAAAVEGLLLIVLVLLRYDTLRDRRSTMARATRSAMKWSIAVPVGILAVLLVPLWVALILIAIPALAVGVMALAS